MLILCSSLAWFFFDIIKIHVFILSHSPPFWWWQSLSSKFFLTSSKLAWFTILWVGFDFISFLDSIFCINCKLPISPYFLDSIWIYRKLPILPHFDLCWLKNLTLVGKVLSHFCISVACSATQPISCIFILRCIEVIHMCCLKNLTWRGKVLCIYLLMLCAPHSFLVSFFFLFAISYSLSCWCLRSF